MHGATPAGSHTHMAPELREQARQRLNRIEGQVRGLQRMVDDDRYCVDILTQVDAAREALRQVGMLVLRNYLQNCVPRAIKDGDEAIVTELMTVMNRFTNRGE